MVLLIALNAFLTPNFATAANAVNILWQVSSVVLVAVGMTLVIATGGIDLSVGSVMAIAGAVVATQLGLGVMPAVLLALIAALAVGLLNGMLIARGPHQGDRRNPRDADRGRGLGPGTEQRRSIVPVRDATIEVGFADGSADPIPVIIAALVVGFAV